MFNVKLTQGSGNILINSIEFDHLRGSGNSYLDVYTTNSGTLLGKEDLPTSWTKVATVILPKDPDATMLTIEPPIPLLSGTARGFYLSAKEGVLIVGFGSLSNHDANGAAITDGTVVFGHFGNSYPGYHLNAKVGYAINP